MGMELYSHNRVAYDAACAMLGERRKAAVIHPTGTGKSFIGFKLCEDHPASSVLWLSPSEYIYKTQTENWLRAGGDELHNIRFLTYAKLMLMDEGELSELLFDFLILDEFHRCGAKLWGQGVKRLQAVHPQAFLLGLTATGIRYLDNQRNMADELFEGNIASEISLGEAIVRGILKPPKYVLSVYSCQKDVERFKERTRRSKKRAADEYLEALRRALDLADGLDVVFERHMPNRRGKYIVFCSGAAHMREMMSLADQWFGRIDKYPHIYSLYASDPSASRSFSDFKADCDRSHLRLLYCIDALNEGIHPGGIDGVILLRPTVSPIVYKQQIGRALSAGEKNEAVIFDIVQNISNLCSIGAIEEEMQTAAAYYRSLGEGDAIVQEHFQIVDEAADCRILFEKLSEVLTTSWSAMYEQAVRYYKENGDLEVPARYVTEEGFSLGRWIYNQRYMRKGVLDGDLTEEKIAKLDAIGMRWDVLGDAGWEKHFMAAKAWYEEHGDLDVPIRSVVRGVSLGQWLGTLRTWERAGAHRKYLTPERKAQLEAIGMVWDKMDRLWERNYAAACAYHREHGNLLVPSGYVDGDGIRLGAWVGRMRKLKAGLCPGTPLTEEQIGRLEAIGMVWEKRNEQAWERCFAAAADYASEHKNLLVPVSFETADGVKLGSWIQRQRLLYKKKELGEERIRRLEQIGMVWDTKPWMRRFFLAEQYCREHGTARIPQNYVTNGCWVGKWLAVQRKMHTEGRLTGEQSELLSSLERFSQTALQA